MGIEDVLIGLVDGSYAAAFDEQLWAAWTGQVITALGGAGGSFHVIDDGGGVVHSHFHLTPRVMDAYFASGFVDHDPQVRVVAGVGRSTIYLDTNHLDRRDPATAQYMRWLVSEARLDHHMTSVSLLGEGKLRGAISIHRHPDDGHTPEDEQRKLAAIFPEITRAMQLGFRHGEKLTEAYWDGLTQTAREPALLLDEAGRVLRASPAMAALIGAADGLDAKGGRLRAADPADDARLQALLARAVARDAPGSGAIRLRRPSGRAALVLTAYPLPRRTRALAPAEAAALVTVVDPADAGAGAPALYREALGLTPRESDLATLLMAGHSVESAAATLSLGVATVRTHLKGLMAKAGATRQSDLLRLLGRIG